jgi:hypothetical protein
LSKIEVNAIEPQCGTNLTVGASGDTITFPSGTTVVNNGSQTGFGRTGTVDWDTTAKTASFTAVSGTGYFVNTTSGAITLTLPASPSAGDIVAFKDYAFTFATNNLTVDGNGSPIGGVDGIINPTYDTNGTSKTFIYVDGTKGWLVTNESTDTSQEQNPLYVTATGGTVTCCGDYKIHVFTGPGTFCVSCAGNSAGSNSLEYLVVAGGGAGGTGEGESAGGGGAGGWRSYTSLACASPLNAPAALPVTATGYPITIGAGGASESKLGPIKNGSNSVFSTITSAGGGAGRPGYTAICGQPPGHNPVPAMNGGSGGGATGNCGPGVAGSGNTPPVSPAQGRDGGDGNLCGGNRSGGGGGGAIAEGSNGTSPNIGGDGGDGAHIPTSFIGPTAPSYGVTGPAGRYFAGGGGGNKQDAPEGSYGSGGLGGGGAAGNPAGTAGTVNTGSGGGAGFNNCIGSGTGGSGIVIIRYKFQ